MKRIVFGLGALQVVVTLLLSALICMLFDMRWQGGVALGGCWQCPDGGADEVADRAARTRFEARA